MDWEKRFKQANTLMVQGTTSDAGKSVLVAGLCRLIHRHGLSVAPFKPQNMALNSAVTADGGEIGRAQAVQAQACFLEPHTDMNPILLKPSSDIGAQVIVQGKALQNMPAKDYHGYKQTAFNAVIDSYERLSGQYQKLVVEGAGSPAEINLRDNDIANMGFAEAVDCPVILVADIDRGGVFAHLVGTLELLSETEQTRIIGFVINRFRGDAGLLKPGIDWLEQRTGKSVIAILPYLTDFYLDAEDAINNQQRLTDDSAKQLRVAVPVFPRISNHTDFDALRLHPEIDLQLVRQGQPIPPSDLIILPGSKNVRADMGSVFTHGWDKDIYRHLRYGGKLIGICGGYQMLGRQINDPDGIEDQPGSCQGLGLLDIETDLMPNKQLINVTGHLNLPNIEPVPFKGYEIHCGVTHGTTNGWIVRSDQSQDGAVSEDGQILGCYQHGLFDKPEAADALLSWAGLRQSSVVDLYDWRESQLDRLADCLADELIPSFINNLTR